MEHPDPEDSRSGPPSEELHETFADTTPAPPTGNSTRHLRRKNSTSGSSHPSRTNARRFALPRKPLWLSAAIFFAVAAGLLVWKEHSILPKPQALPAEAVGDAPPSATPAVDVAAAAASAPASAPEPLSATGNKPGISPNELDLANENAQTLDDLLDGQKALQTTLDNLEREVGAIAAQLKQTQVQQQAAAGTAPRAKLRSPAEASAQVPRQAQLLAVDIWDGKPSVVLGTTDARDNVRFLREGDQHGSVTVKQVDAQRQRAIFDVAGKPVELSLDGTD